MGSHPQACDRTQGKYAQFVQSKETSCYLYSMTQTDSLLSQLYDQLRRNTDSFSMVYFSDFQLQKVDYDSLKTDLFDPKS